LQATALIVKLIRELAKSNGIDLLVCAIHGYPHEVSDDGELCKLISEDICGGEVPIVLAVVGNEGFPGSSWWKETEEGLKDYRTIFADYADLADTKASGEPLRHLISSNCRPEPWKQAAIAWSKPLSANKEIPRNPVHDQVSWILEGLAGLRKEDADELARKWLERSPLVRRWATDMFRPGVTPLRV
jgi:hypothetical protein